MTPEERFDAAIEIFEKKEYSKAKVQFQILTLNYMGTLIADKSQYFLAESHFGLKEYIIAASEYEKLVRNYPRSEFVDDAQYKLGLCFYELSPIYSLDQKYTIMALNELQKFLEEYPGSNLKSEGEKILAKCRAKLAKKDFRNAEQYRKSSFFSAAIIYYDEVLDNFYDTPYAEEALYRKGFCLMKLQKWEEAQQLYEVFLAKYPDSRFAESVKDDLRIIQTKLVQE